MKNGQPNAEQVANFAQRMAQLLTDADDLGISWTTDERTYYALRWGDAERGVWVEGPVIGWNGRYETWAPIPGSAHNGDYVACFRAGHRDARGGSERYRRLQDLTDRSYNPTTRGEEIDDVG